MPNCLVQPLFDGPVDIVGDVHGEIDALLALLHHLGYSENGTHPKQRRLVFLGDLTDRGPDSPGVVDLVHQLVDAGRAQCILGNHDLNLLLGQRKKGNRWFFGEHESLDGSDEPTPATLADDAVRQKVLDFFRSLPIALERNRLKVVHACWHDEMIDHAREADDAVGLYEEHATRIAAQRPASTDEVEQELAHQNDNPVKVLTSGLEQRAGEPFETGGKVRNLERVHWWKEYEGEDHCVFGHYSAFHEEDDRSGRAICADFAVGKRWKERRQPSFDGTFRTRLAAVRFPDQHIVYDHGARKTLIGSSGGKSR